MFFLACSHNTGAKEQPSELVSENNSKEMDSEYKLIKDNLYSDGKGNLYLKSRTREHFETGRWLDVWIKTIYCDTCWTPTEGGLKDISELKNFVDRDTWQYDTSNGYWTEYIDKSYRYHHTHMDDGGTISLESK